LQILSSCPQVVIPGKRSPARHGVQGEARPGIQVFQAILDSGFRRNGGFEDFFKSLKIQFFFTVILPFGF